MVRIFWGEPGPWLRGRNARQGAAQGGASIKKLRSQGPRADSSASSLDSNKSADFLMQWLGRSGFNLAPKNTSMASLGITKDLEKQWGARDGNSFYVIGSVPEGKRKVCSGQVTLPGWPGSGAGKKKKGVLTGNIRAAPHLWIPKKVRPEQKLHPRSGRARKGNSVPAGHERAIRLAGEKSPHRATGDPETFGQKGRRAKSGFWFAKRSWKKRNGPRRRLGCRGETHRGKRGELRRGDLRRLKDVSTSLGRSTGGVVIRAGGSSEWKTELHAARRRKGRHRRGRKKRRQKEKRESARGEMLRRRLANKKAEIGQEKERSRRGYERFQEIAGKGGGLPPRRKPR